MGRGTDQAKLKQPVRNVACWIDAGQRRVPAHLRLAIAYASAVGARLHLLQALPEIHEGAVVLPGPGAWPIHEDGARRAILQLVAGEVAHPEIHVSAGYGMRGAEWLLKSCNPDLIFSNVERVPFIDWLYSDLDRVDSYACPTICVSSKAPTRDWISPQGPGFEVRAGERRNARFPRQIVGMTQRATVFDASV
jgi:hypothetical protein